MTILKKKKIIIKIGSALLLQNNQIRISWLEKLAEDIKILQDNNVGVIIVSSGSVTIGKKYIKAKRMTDAKRRALSSIGQAELTSSFYQTFKKYNLNIAQILHTGDEYLNRENYLNAIDIFKILLKNKTIAIINENDTILTEDIKIGNNDKIAARIVQMADADMMILLSDIDGLYDKNPKLHSDAKLIKKIDKITAEIENMAGDTVTKFGTGGMKTKIEAVKMAFNTGCDVIIANGLIDHPIKNIIDSENYSFFKSDRKKINAKKRWISDSLNFKGKIIINQKAAKALVENGSSLLPVGVMSIEGEFHKSDMVLIIDDKNQKIATGVISYNSTIARLIIGKNSAEIKKIVKKDFCEELVHRDNLALKRSIDN
ncbi:glutamate 5-kinase [Rickettsiales bacterium]|nr:glutamate 5-kinase [Rickettsiales bacterium]